MRPRTYILTTAIIAAILTIASTATAAPEIDFTLDNSPIHPGEPFLLTVEITWHQQDLYPAPPQIQDFDWGQATLTTVSCTTTDGINKATYKIQFTPNDIGTYQTPKIDFILLPPTAAQTMQKDSQETPNPQPEEFQKLTLEALPISVSPRKTTAWLLGGLGLALIIIIAATAIRAKTKRSANHAQHPQNAIQTPQKTLHKAKKLKLDADIYAFYQALIQAIEQTDNPQTHSDLIKTLKERAKAIGFQGYKPTADQLEYDLKSAEKACKPI